MGFACLELEWHQGLMHCRLIRSLLALEPTLDGHLLWLR
jgi:hypothetical protein